MQDLEPDLQSQDLRSVSCLGDLLACQSLRCAVLGDGTLALRAEGQV